MSPEIPKPKIPEIHFKPEGYLSPDNIEFLEQLIEKLKASGFDPDQMVYSGTDGNTIIKPDGSIESPLGVFAMNEAGWKKAIELREATPAGYAERYDKAPCIALYDRRQLANAYSYEMRQDEANYEEPIELANIVPGEALDGLPLETPVEEVVIHKDFPNASPSEALIGLVFLELE